jgi:class 3 adenylate cyclase
MIFLKDIFDTKKAFILIGFFCILSISAVSQQNQILADSLILGYKSGFHKGLKILAKIAEAETNPEVSLEYANILIKEASKESSDYYLHKGYLQKGNALQFKGDNSESLKSYLKSLEYANRIGDDKGIGSLMISIAGLYTGMDNFKSAQKYYSKGIELLRKTNDSVKIATALLNAGDDYFNAGELDSALAYSKESESIFKNLDYNIGVAYSTGNIGMINAELGNHQEAETSMNEAIGLLEELEDYYPITVYLIYMSDIYLDKEEHQTALAYAHRSLSLAQQYQLKEQISEANRKLSELYEIVGNLEVSYKHYKDHIAYRDSIVNLENVQQIADMRTDYEVSQKQVEVNLLETQKRNQLIILGFIGLMLLASLWFYWAISKEKKRSEKLLLNILPEDTAKELKLNGKVKAKQYDSVTVLFTDFKGFTSYSEKLSPEALVETVDYYFSKFDAIMEKYGLEKIKTIGDAYMCVGGLHGDTQDHPDRMVKAAFEIADFVEATKKDIATSEFTFDIRIGINTGPVVAGVVGTKKFAYDIWGDAVNVASRMESMSEPGKINISENTYQLIKDEYACEYRGEIPVKNRGNMKMYFVLA